MFTPESQIQQAILHPLAAVRAAAVDYFADSYSPDTKIIELVIETIREHGLDAFVIWPFFRQLAHTEASVAWMIDEIEQGISEVTFQRVDYIDELYLGLQYAHPRVLTPLAERIAESDFFDGEIQKAIAERIRLFKLPLEDLWDKWSEFSAREEDDLDGDEEVRYDSFATAFAQYPEVGSRVHEILNSEDASPENVILAMYLAGKFRLGSVAGALLDRLGDIDSWLLDQPYDSLAQIGSDEVVKEITQRFDDATDSDQSSFAAMLRHIHTELSLRTCLTLSGQPLPLGVQARLLQSALLMFSTDAIEPARQFVRDNLKCPEVLDVRKTLLTAAEIMGASFAELEAWTVDAKDDPAHLQQWYEDHPEENPFIGDDDLEEGEWDDLEDDFDDDDGENDEDDEVVAPYPDDEPDVYEPPAPIVRQEKRVGRNDPCPCGSGKKFKQCCYGKQAVDVDDHRVESSGSGQAVRQSPPEYPIGTVAKYGPDETTTTKIVGGVIRSHGAEPLLERWVGTNIGDSPKVRRQLQEFFERHHVKSVAICEGNMGCPHEEGEDFPIGEDCPFCPYWAGKQGSNRRD